MWHTPSKESDQPVHQHSQINLYIVGHLGPIDSSFRWQRLIGQHRYTGWSRTSLCPRSNEPSHDKTNKMARAPSEDSDQPGYHPVWSESSLSAWGKLGSLATYRVHSEDSDQTGGMPKLIWAFAQSDQSSLGAQSFCWFCHVVTQTQATGEGYVQYPASGHQ